MPFPFVFFELSVHGRDFSPGVASEKEDRISVGEPESLMGDPHLDYSLNVGLGVNANIDGINKIYKKFNKKYLISIYNQSNL